MEGMEKIKNKILEDARVQAQAIIEEAEGKAQDTLDQASKKAADLKEKLFEKGQVEADEARKRMLAMEELAIRKEELAIKQKLINQAFEKALEGLKNIKGGEYKELAVNMVKISAVNGDEEVVASTEDRKLFEEGLLKEINKKLGLNLKLSEETRNIKGGFILKSHGIEINNSFETLIRMERDQIETKIADILFEN